MDKCPTCETPRLEGMNALVLYFDTEADLKEFVEAFKEVKPNARAVPLAQIAERG